MLWLSEQALNKQHPLAICGRVTTFCSDPVWKLVFYRAHSIWASTPALHLLPAQPLTLEKVRNSTFVVSTWRGSLRKVFTDDGPTNLHQVTLTPNHGFCEWGEVFDDNVDAAAQLDHLLQFNELHPNWDGTIYAVPHSKTADSFPPPPETLAAEKTRFSIVMKLLS